MVTTTRRIYLAEWMEEKEFSEQRLADALGVARETVNRWINHPGRLGYKRMQEIAAAMRIDAGDLWRHPGQESADALLRDVPDKKRAHAIAMLKLMLDESE